MDSKATFEIYTDNAGNSRWRLVHDNGKIIADSGEAYDSESGAKMGIASVKGNAADAQIKVLI